MLFRSIAVTGSAVQWLRDQLGIISGAAQSETLAAEVEDNGGVYFVPAFSGLFAPYWRSDARGAIVGLSRFNSNAHVARATLEAICYQSRDVVDAMEADSGVHLGVLKVDGGVTLNELCMQIQADVLGVDASVIEVVEEPARYVVSVRFTGTMREDNSPVAEAFDEIWHLVKPRAGTGGWLLSGIQQVAQA